MTLQIAFTPSEEAKLKKAANDINLPTEEMIKMLVEKHLLREPVSLDDDIDAKLRRWQEQDGRILRPPQSIKDFSTQMAEEYALMTDEERAEDARIWGSVEESLLKGRNPSLVKI